MSTNSEKTLDYLTIQEGLQYKNLRVLFKGIIIYVKEYFYMFFSTLKDIIQAQSKTNP